MGEFEIERALAGDRLRRRDLRRPRTDGGAQGFHFLAGHRFIVDQPGRTRIFAVRQRQRRLRRGQARARFGEGGEERPLVDGEQKLPALDDIAVADMHADQLAGDARAYLDRLAGLEPARIVVPFDNVARQRLGDGDGRRRRRIGARRAAAEQLVGRISDKAEQDQRGQALAPRRQRPPERGVLNRRLAGERNRFLVFGKGMKHGASLQ
jgi:hypothetical protein